MQHCAGVQPPARGDLLSLAISDRLYREESGLVLLLKTPFPENDPCLQAPYFMIKYIFSF
jgi:hypothetical protein